MNRTFYTTEAAVNHFIASTGIMLFGEERKAVTDLIAKNSNSRQFVAELAEEVLAESALIRSAAAA